MEGLAVLQPGDSEAFAVGAPIDFAFCVGSGSGRAATARVYVDARLVAELVGLEAGEVYVGGVGPMTAGSYELQVRAVMSDLDGTSLSSSVVRFSVGGAP
jgi:hypothetical protein